MKLSDVAAVAEATATVSVVSPTNSSTTAAATTAAAVSTTQGYTTTSVTTVEILGEADGVCELSCTELSECIVNAEYKCDTE